MIKIEVSIAGNRGMSLVGVVVGIGIMTALTIGMLGIVANLAGTITAAEGNSEALNQIQLAKIALAVPNACKLNFSGKDLTSGLATINSNQFPRYVEASGAVLSVEPIFPSLATQVRIHAKAMNIVRITDKTAQLAITFFRNGSGMAGGEVFRTLPVAITLNSLGRIVDCSTDTVNGSAANRPPPQMYGNCDKAPIGGGLGPVVARNPSSQSPIEDAKTAIKEICGKLEFPTGASPRISCSDFNAKKSDWISKVHFANRIGHGLKIPVDNGKEFFGLGYPNDSCTGVNRELGTGFQNLASQEECEGLPAIPQGSTILSSGDPTAVPLGLCINSRIVPIEKLPPPPPSDGGGLAE